MFLCWCIIFYMVPPNKLSPYLIIEKKLIWTDLQKIHDLEWVTILHPCLNSENAHLLKIKQIFCFIFFKYLLCSVCTATFGIYRKRIVYILIHLAMLKGVHRGKSWKDKLFSFVVSEKRFDISYIYDVNNFFLELCFLSYCLFTILKFKSIIFYPTTFFECSLYGWVPI